MQIRLKRRKVVNVDLIALLTEGVHGSHDKEAPVGGHEAGGKGESGPGLNFSWAALRMFPPTRLRCLQP